jgi:hypothetical protein
MLLWIHTYTDKPKMALMLIFFALAKGRGSTHKLPDCDVTVQYRWLQRPHFLRALPRLTTEVPNFLLPLELDVGHVLAPEAWRLQRGRPVFW